MLSILNFLASSRIALGASSMEPIIPPLLIICGGIIPGGGIPFMAAIISGGSISGGIWAETGAGGIWGGAEDICGGIPFCGGIGAPCGAIGGGADPPMLSAIICSATVSVGCCSSASNRLRVSVLRWISDITRYRGNNPVGFCPSSKRAWSDAPLRISSC